MARYDQSLYLYLTTIGRYSGEPREIEIWFILLDGIYYLISEHGEESNWVKNIRHDPQIHFSIGNLDFAGSARIVDDTAEPDLAALVRTQFDAKYGWSDGLVVALKPEPAL